ncbi:uncharacterized protein [Diadema setosum]|uniref:uncharacterized protein n=1 Tax=Diadema antillarum TaxID=105358 RepID=UPI003A84A407
MTSSFKQFITQKLECPICLNIYKEPRTLPCSHTFCKRCLTGLLRSQPGKVKLPCPVCKQVTAVPTGDVSQLQVHKTLNALVDDVQNKSQLCTSCPEGEQKPAVSFCQECDMDMCAPCVKVHSQWKRFASHNVVSMNEMVTGKVALKRRRKCKKHPGEDEECFCADCRKHVCFRCGMLEHAHAGHKILEAVVHEEILVQNIQDLKNKSTIKKSAINKYIDFIQKQRLRLKSLSKHLSDDIDKAYNESIEHLAQRRELLQGKVTRRIEELELKLHDLEDECKDRITNVDTIEELVSNGMKIPLEQEALAAHDSMCQELERVLGRDGEEFDYDHPSSTAKEGERLRFVRNVGSGELDLGQIREAESRWMLENDIQLPAKDCMNGMAPTPDGMMAIGSQFGGIHLFSADGQYGTALNSVEIRAIACMADGRYTIRDDDNNILLYTKQLSKLGIKFGTLTDAEGGPGGLTVDGEDNIYVSYMKTMHIQVFPGSGGQAIRDIPCDDHMPMQLFGMKSAKALVVRSSANSARVIDTFGRTLYTISKDAKTMAYPSACADGTILIAWVKHESALVTIDQYTAELKHTKTIVADQKIQKPQKRNWYFLQKFKSGEIAFSTPDRLYIFNKLME